MWRGILLVALYVAFVSCPLFLVSLQGPQLGNSFFYELGKSFALTGFMILALQAVVAGRITWIERPYGFDILIRYHRYMAIFATLLLVSHPLLLAWGGAGWWLFTAGDVRWYIWVGRATLVIVLLNMLLSLFQSRLNLKFERWRVLHDILSPAILILAFLHSWFAGSDLLVAPLRLLWVGILGAAMIIFLYHRFARPWRLSRLPYKVIDVQQETRGVWTIKLAPPVGQKRLDFLPGQFHFLTFRRGRDLPVEEHHWTISSSPMEKDFLSSTIKELGDFTSTIGQTRPGDRAVVHGPFGRFSYVLHPEENDLVFIAGGIGITPLMSMLRHMRDIHSTIPVTLIYANRSEGEIAFHQELMEMEEAGNPPLSVSHVLSKPGDDWSGEKGRIDREKIQRYCGQDLQDKAFYLCGPPGLVEASIENLRDLGVSDGRIHVEIFSFVD